MSYNEWKEYTLDEVCISITDGSHSSPKSVENGYPMASVKDMGYFEINIDSCRQISEEDYQKLVNGKCKPEINDVLIAKDGSYMKFVNVVKEEKDLVLLSSIAILKPNIDILNPLFLKYYLLTPNVKHELEYGYVSGSAIRRIVLKDFKRFPIKLPPLEEQEKIADILSSLDDKIELNNEMNKTLEEMAQSIFKRWFVDFEFPNEDGEPYKSSGGEMVDSELGMIPKGWKYGTLDDIANINMGVSPKSSSYNTENIGMPLLNGASDFNGTIINPTKHTTEPKKICKKDDMVFCIRATIGNLTFADKEYCIGRGVASVTPKDEKYREFIYFNINNSIQSLISQATGSVFLNLTKDNINKMKIVIPTKEVLNKFSEITSNIINKVQSNNVENEGLINLRDSLLPKLMSGELKVLK